MHTTSSLLRTNVVSPSPHRRLLRRSSVLEVLRELWSMRLAIVQAGTGYIKTTVLATLATEIEVLVRDVYGLPLSPSELNALARSGHTRTEIDYLTILDMKPAAHSFVLKQPGLLQDQTVYLADDGHMGQQDQALSIKPGLESGRLHDGDLMVSVAAGIGYAWAASVVQWGPRRSGGRGGNPPSISGPLADSVDLCS